MKPSTISLRRRQLMIAGAAAAPASALAGQAGDALIAGLSAGTAHGKLVVSGRILDRDGQTLRGAKVELVNARAEETTITTDADGRFLFTTAAASRIDYRIVHDGEATPVRQLRFGGEHVARLDRDSEGTWRTTFGLTLA
ncbi:MAG TPA: carboxypeptidase-like regulatory domain-containing protein [Burkholderiales bacterium]|nr:carboxypeptidase-like regulatory domain-containing protein [Burkholderiales bacterium]